VEDNVPSSPVTLTADQINIHAENVSTKKDSRGSLSYSLRVNERGTISAESSFGINPVAADVTLDVKGIDITALQPYINEKVNILITGGSFAASGTLSYDASEGEELTVSYKGDVSLSKFSSVDKAKANDFLKWNSLYITGIDFEYDPLTVKISEVALTDYYSRLIIHPDGTLNVQNIIKKEESAGESSSQASEEKAVDAQEKEIPESQININTITLQAGTVNFSDRHIKPNFSANLLEIGGRVSGLSSAENTQADVDLRGKLENYAPLEIKGKINPFGEDLFVDLDVDFHDMDLSPLTPYSHKYVGYTIQKGKLSLDLKYLIEKKKLDSSNSIFLDQFTLGEKVESPEATKLPVKFALSLLKNSKGEISLDLPVKGSIDDPEFSIGSVIVKMFVNLIVKAVTSPFKLLGALVGGGEELSYIGFDSGKSGLNDPEKAKLDKLAKALSDRPALNIEVAGYADIEKDREALVQYSFDSKLRAQKLKDMVKKGDKALPLDDVTIETEEYEKYLRKAYKQEKFPKPRNFLGIAKKLPPPEMEKLIFTYIEVLDDDLRLLASKRALNVKEYFIETGQIDSKRIFLIEPEALQPEKDEGLKKSRVDFKLK
jgi:flagellar motor protein MotB